MEDSKSLMGKNDGRMSPEVDAFNKKISETLDRSLEMLKASALKEQIGGNHYKNLRIQPMEYSMENNLNACQHTIIKYVTRYKDKGGIQDLEKAKHCIDLLIEFENRWND